MSQTKQPTNTGALATLVMVFFFWGFIAASNSIFIPFCKTHFNLNQFQSQLIGSAFYGAYFIGSLILFIVSNLLGKDILNKIGYKRGIIYGLLISVVGALLIIPSANANSFPAILASFFVVALGFSLQQTAAQPFAISLGDPATGSHRLNLGGGVNSLGTTLGPIIVSFFLFGSVGGDHVNVTVTNINTLYLIVAAVFAAVAIIFAISKLPDGKNDEKFEKANKAAGSLLIMTLLIGAIIVVGQLTEESKISKYVSLYWGSLMIGRWTGAVSVFNLKGTLKKLMTIVVPFIAFAVVMGVNHLYGNDISDLFPYAAFIVLAVAAFFFGQEKPVKTLLTVSLLATAFMLIGVFASGILSVYTFMAGGLCCSVMWPCIFSLGVGGLGKYTSQGSAFLIMMILGGAIIPPLQGAIGDKTSMHHSYLLAAGCFAFLAFLALKLKSVLQAQGLDFDEQVSSGH